MEYADSVIKDLDVAEAENFRTSVEKILILFHFEEHMRVMQTRVAMLTRDVTLSEDTAKIQKILESGRSIYRLDCHVKLLKLTLAVQRLLGSVKPVSAKMKTISSFVE